jgi:hypothetical protein
VPFPASLNASTQRRRARETTWTQATITTVDAPGAGTGAGELLAAGTIAGSYAEANSLNHGYIRTLRGTFTTFDVPGEGAASGQGTITEAIDSTDAITGYYTDGSGVTHGFLRSPNGVITTFNAPAAGAGSGQGTVSMTNNTRSRGITLMPAAYHGFLRSP